LLFKNHVLISYTDGIHLGVSVNENFNKKFGEAILLIRT
jgi:hypothetical protein